MLKFLYMGDRHNSETTPMSRTDDYQSSCELKDLEIINIAKEHGVCAILHPGDFWTDSDRRIGNEFIGNIARRWLGAGVPLIGIAGNHDLIGNNADSLPGTTSGLLHSLGIFKILQNGETVEFSDGEITVALTGTNYHKGMDRPEFINDYIVSQKKADYHLHLVHGMLSPTNLGKIIRHTTIDSVKSTMADVTLCGHDHIGFGIINYNNKYFVNPGAVVRMSCDRRELDRKISVVLISIDKDNGIKLEQIHLKSAKSGPDVISREHIEEKLAKSSYEEYVKDGVAKLKIGNNISITDVLDEIYERDEIPNNIKESISKQILEKTESLKQKAINAPDGTEITHISIHNFQSHADTELDLDPNFNVIIGESHQGKSAILRAIRWVAENKPSGKGVIRIGETEASVQLTLKNGTIIRRFISGKDNGYKVFTVDGEVLEGNTHMVGAIQELMGWNSMPIGEGDKIPLNHLKQGDSWYLIGDRYTSSDRARILGSINNTDGADAAIKEFDKLNSRISDAMKHEEVEVVNLTQEIKNAEDQKQKFLFFREIVKKAILAEKIKHYLELRLDYEQKEATLNELENIFDENRAKLKIESIKKTLSLMDSVKTLLQKHELETSRMTSAIDALSALSSLRELDIKVSGAKQKIDLVREILRQRVLYETSIANLSASQEIINSTNTAASVNIDSIKERIIRYEQIYKYNVIYTKSTSSLSAANKMIEESKDINLFPERKKIVLERLQRIGQITDLLRTRDFLIDGIAMRSDKLKSAEENYTATIEQKIDILREAHICPTCYSEIDDKTISDIAEKARI